MSISSEDAKNWATVVAILAGGLWALTEFYVLGPQRTTDTQTASAQLVSRVNTAISAQITADEDDISDWRAACAASADKKATIHLDTRLSMAVESPMPIPVSIKVQDVALRRFGRGTPSLGSSDGPTTPVSGISGPEAFEVHWSDFIASSTDRRVDPGERIQFYYASYLPFVFDCTDTGTTEKQEIAIGFRYFLESPNTLDDPSTSHSTMTVCLVELSSESNCSTDPESTPVGLARGLNAQWSDGGIIYTPPFR